MSGEEYGWLHSMWADELLDRVDDLKRMVEDLDQLDYAADITNSIRIVLETVEFEKERRDEMEKHIEKLIQFVSGPMKAFNWWQSSDSSEEQFKEELRRWRERRITD